MLLNCSHKALLSFPPKPLTSCHHTHQPNPQVTSRPLRLTRRHGNKLISIQFCCWMVRSHAEKTYCWSWCHWCHYFLKMTGHPTHTLSPFFLVVFHLYSDLPFFFTLIFLCNLTTLHWKRNFWFGCLCHGWCVFFIDPLQVFWALERTIAEYNYIFS